MMKANNLNSRSPAVSRDGPDGHDVDEESGLGVQGSERTLVPPRWTLCKMPLEIDIATLPRKLPVMVAPPRQLTDEEAAAVPIPQEWREEFEAAAQRPLQQRMRYALFEPTNRCLTMPCFARGIRPHSTANGARPACPTGWGMGAFDYRQAEEFLGREGTQAGCMCYLN